jgi:serine protease Do
MGILDEQQDTIRELRGQVGPSVVGLGRGWGRGSGVVIAENRVLTNAHVLRGDEVAVARGDEVLHGRVAGADADLDVAVVEVDTGGAPAVRWEPGLEAAAGLPVFALADPGGRGLRVSFGVITATGRSFRGPRGRRIGGSIEHSAPLPRGSSGGPLVDASGRLLGLNTVRMEGGLLLALPADAALRERVTALGRGEVPAHPRLGLAIAPPRAARRLRAAVGLPPRDGLLVREVEEGGPGDAAGLERGDLLVAAGGRALGGVDDLFDALAASDGALELVALRGTEERTVVARFN